MQEKLFRQAALEKLSSPEELDQLMQVTTPRGWLALLALIIFIGLVLGISFFTSIPVRVEAAYCQFRLNSEGVLKATLYVSASEATIEVPDAVQIQPLFGAKQTGEFMTGSVSYAGTSPVSLQAIEQVVDNPNQVDKLLEIGNLVEIEAELFVTDQLQSSKTGYIWLLRSGGKITIQDKMLCTANIHVDEKKPIELILRNFR
jgi:hypothetical protein